MRNKLRKVFAVILTLSLIMNLFSVMTFAEANVSTDVCEVCGKVIHTHTADCYKYYFVASGSNTRVETSSNATASDADGSRIETDLECNIQVIDHSKCNNLPDDVKIVSKLLVEMPTLAEMKAARRGAYAPENNTGSALKDLEKAYMDYIADGFEKRENAKEAYDELSSNLKGLIDADLANKLNEKLEIGTSDLSKNIKRGKDDYVYQFVEPYEYSNHETLADNTIASFIMVDTDKYNEKTWKPNDKEYNPGVSNYDVTYCCDNGTSLVDDTYYSRVNLEDSGYYSEDAANRIRAIVMSSYPFISLTEMKDTLRGKLKHIDGSLFTNNEIDAIEEVDVMAATQMAIWNYANESLSPEQLKNRTTYGWTYGMYSGYRSLVNETWRWWQPSTNFKESMFAEYVLALTEHMKNLTGVAPDKNQVVINNVNILSAEPVQATNETGVYKVAMRITLNNSGNSKTDNITISATSYTVDDETKDRIVTGQSEVPTKDGILVYDLALNAKNGEVIEVVVSGNQYLPSGVYFYQPEPKDKNNDGIATSREASQNLVGIAMGSTVINAKESVTVNIPENVITTGSISIKKESVDGTALSGASFSLYQIQDTNINSYTESNAVKVDTLTTDIKGELKIDSLLPGSYELTEDTAPAGYSKPDGKISFTIKDDGSTTDIAASGQLKALTNITSVEDVVVKNNKNVSISVEKKWEYDNKQVRPTEIKVQLLNNNVLENEVYLSEENDWKFTWNDLDYYGTWTVDEVVPKDYECSISKSADGMKFTITNKYDPEETPTAPTEPPTTPTEPSTTPTEPSTTPTEPSTTPTEPSSSPESSEPETTTPSYVGDDDDEPETTPQTIVPTTTVPETTVPETTVPETVTYRGVQIPKEILDAYPGKTLDELYDMGVLGAYFENIPTGLLPATNDMTVIWTAMSVLSAVGLAGVSVVGRKRKEDDEE